MSRPALYQAYEESEAVAFFGSPNGARKQVAKVGVNSRSANAGYPFTG
jgi:hypothetical protein